MKRWKMSRKKSKTDFRRKAGSHPRNFSTAPMRGGIRL